MIKRFFILMTISCMLLVGCGSATEKSTPEKTTTAPECDICHQANASRDWKLVSASTNVYDLYWYECKYCGNVIRVLKPIIKECYQK